MDDRTDWAVPLSSRRVAVDALGDALGDGLSNVELLLERARGQLERLAPPEAARFLAGEEALLVDIRTDAQRAADGVVPGAAFVPRNELEWRLDPSSPWRDPSLARPEATVILLCAEGYQSSLAAATLHELGLPRATDVVGGFRAWRDSGLPVQPPDG
jgi:rhodanese-related sulfurtransferase